MPKSWRFHAKIWILFVCFDSLCPVNNLSVIKRRVFLSWTSTKLGLMFLLKDTTQPLSQALYHWANAPHLVFNKFQCHVIIETNTCEPVLLNAFNLFQKR